MVEVLSVRECLDYDYYESWAACGGTKADSEKSEACGDVDLNTLECAAGFIIQLIRIIFDLRILALPRHSNVHQRILQVRCIQINRQ